LKGFVVKNSAKRSTTVCDPTTDPSATDHWMNRSLSLNKFSGVETYFPGSTMLTGATRSA
jgi:hypothetical protein